MSSRFEGTLTARDCKRHIPHRLALPQGCGRLDIRFSYEPPGAYGISNLITLTLFDPHGFRGAGHRGGTGYRDGTSHYVRIEPDDATPGYLPGPLPPGEWIVQLDTHMIMPDPPVRYVLEVSWTPGAEVSPALLQESFPVMRSVPQTSGWYRGDLHCHSHHSDADDFTVEMLLRAARDAGLDFVFLTDHNTTSGLREMDAEMRAMPGSAFLAAGGIELTTYWGHALCLGARDWVDWRVRPGTGAMTRIAEEVESRGQVFVIAHPQSVGDPGCTGCAWRFGELAPGVAPRDSQSGSRLVEVWNGPWGGDSNNEASLALWYDWLNEGLRLVATAGTDAHAPEHYVAPPEGDAPVFSVIYAEALTEAALLKALRAGHLYLSAGPRLSLQARDARGTRRMGDVAVSPAGLALTWAACPAGARVRVLANGRLLRQWPAQGQGEHAWTMASGQADWVVVEIRSADGAMLALTNPIFLRDGDVLEDAGG